MLGANIEFGEDRIQKLVDAENKLEARLSELSSARVEYDKLEQEVAKKSEVLGQARQDLVQVQSVGQSTIDLLTRVGEPQVSTRPDGPGKRTIVGAGILGGLLIGLGLIMFTAPPFEDDDQSETLSHPGQNQPRSQQLSEVELASLPPVTHDAAASESQPPAFAPTEDPVPPKPVLPALIQSPASQSESEILPGELPEVVFQPRNVLAELNAQAQSALSSRKQSHPETEDVATFFQERRVIPTRRKTETTPAADSEFVAAISKVSAEARRNFAESKSKTVARPKLITDLFNPASENETSKAARSKMRQPVAEIEIVDEQATFIKISNEPVQNPDHSSRLQAHTSQIEIQPLPSGPKPSQLSSPLGHRPTTDNPVSTEPLAEHKIQRKSNVRPIDLSKTLQDLNLRKTDPQAANVFVSPETVLPSDGNETQNADGRPRGSKRQSAVTEQVFVKQIYTTLDETDLNPQQADSMPENSEPVSEQADADDVKSPVTKPVAAEDSGGAAGREEVLQWGSDISDALSAAEIVKQLRDSNKRQLRLLPIRSSMFRSARPTIPEIQKRSDQKSC